MIALGIILMVAGVGSALYGIILNNDIESQLSSLFSSGQTNPGSLWIVVGVAGVLLGLLFVILGATRKKPVVTQQIFYGQPGQPQGAMPYPPYQGGPAYPQNQPYPYAPQNGQNVPPQYAQQPPRYAQPPQPQYAQPARPPQPPQYAQPSQQPPQPQTAQASPSPQQPPSSQNPQP